MACLMLLLILGYCVGSTHQDDQYGQHVDMADLPAALLHPDSSYEDWQDPYDLAESEDIDDHYSLHRQMRSVKDDPEYKMLMALTPLLKNPPNVHFWRPQKVGSSTIVSLLVSFAYRYNLLPKRKAGINLFCRKIAKCAWEYLGLSDLESFKKGDKPGSYASPSGASNLEFKQRLKDYINFGGKWPELNEHGRPKRAIAAHSPNARANGLDRVAELLGPSYFNVQHDLCHLDTQLIRDHMECGFSKVQELDGLGANATTRQVRHRQVGRSAAAGAAGEGVVSEKDLLLAKKAMLLFGRSTEPVLPLDVDVMTQSIDLKIKDKGIGNQASAAAATAAAANPNARGGSKELFQVRDPLSRAISVYYFWGELFKLRKSVKTNGLGGAAGGKRAARKRSRGEDLQEAGVGRAAAQAGGRFDAPKDADLEQSAGGNLPPLIQLNSKRVKTRKLSAISETWEKFSGILKKRKHAIGQNNDPGGSGDEVQGFFKYHGNELTVPPDAIAMEYAENLHYNAGMPGPSLTWSSFAQSAAQAIRMVYDNDRIMTLVTERMDESLVVAAHYLGWSLADVVNVKNRKDLSQHPKSSAWPVDAVSKIKQRLEENGEYDMYRAASKKLDARISALKHGTWKSVQQGAGTAYAPLVNKLSRTEGKKVNVEEEVLLLGALRARVSEMCLTEEYLVRYRDHMKQQGLPNDTSMNKLRDSADEYADQGHMFSFNNNILFSYDVCGTCEAHALLLAYKPAGSGSGAVTKETMEAQVKSFPSLSSLTRSDRERNVDFANCP